MSKTKEYADTLNVICKDCGSNKKLLEDCEGCKIIKVHYKEIHKKRKR